MTLTFRPASRTAAVPLIGLYGQSGCGKTMSALLLARGLVGPSGKVAMIDTESGRGELYSDVIPGGYDVLQISGDFSSKAYMDAIKAANGYDCIIIDSASHEWEGVGGVTDQAARIEERSGKPGLHCWKAPKMEHQKFMLTLLQAKAPVICCLRAKFKSRQAKNPRTGKTEIVKDEHTTPIQDEAFIYEMTAHAEIMHDHTLRVTKISHPRLADVFKTGEMISADTGAKLAQWANVGTKEPPGASPPLTPASPEVDSDAPRAAPPGGIDEKWLWNKAGEIADMENAAKLRTWFDALSTEGKLALNGDADRWADIKARAAKVKPHEVLGA